MGFEQDTLIYIEENDKNEASIAAKGFADSQIKNRAYINILGAELAVKYLSSENIDVSNIFNLHNIKKILEENDISDIMLPNIHIDVRVVFDENYIFIPKTHFENGLVPDIYLAFTLAKDLTHVKFLGFFEPKLINKNNQNNEYYFIEKEKLSPVSDLKNYILNYAGNTTEQLSEEVMETSERIIAAMVDNDITENEKKILIRQLTKSAELRDKFIEFENFELLSYNSVNDPMVTKPENILETIPEISDFTEIDEIVDTDYSEETDELEEIIIDEIINPEDEEEKIQEIAEISPNYEEFNFEELETVEDINDDDNDFNFDEIETIEDTIVNDIDNDLSTDKQDFETPETEPNSDNSNDTKNNGSIIGEIATIGTSGVIGLGIGAGAAIASEAISEFTNGTETVNEVMDLLNNGLELANSIVSENNITEKQENTSTEIEISEPTENIFDEENKIIDVSADFIENEVSVEDLPSFEDINSMVDNVIVDTPIENEDFVDEISEINEIPEIENREEAIEDLTECSFLETENTVEEINEEVPTLNQDINITELGNQFISTPIEEEIETISFDNIDTSSLIPEEEEEIENEIISLDNVDTSEIHPDIDIDEDAIDNKISLEEMRKMSDTNIEDSISEEIESEILSLDGIDTSNLIDTDYEEQVFTEEIISLDSVDTSNIHPNIDMDESLIDNTIRFDEVEEFNEPEDENFDIEELEPIEDIEEAEELNELENENFDVDEIEDSALEEVEANYTDDGANAMDTIDDINENMSFDNINIENLETGPDDYQGEKMSLEDFDGQSERYEQNIETDDFMDDTISLDDVQAIEENPSAETFGKNLIDGLTNENGDISIEGLADLDTVLADTDLPVDNISSNDLLAQIDDILNTNETSETEAIESEPQDYRQPQSEVYEKTYNINTNLGDNEDKLGMLFDDNQNLNVDDDDDNDDDSIESLQDYTTQPVDNNTLNQQKIMSSEKGKKGVVVAAVLVAILASATALTMLKPKNDVNKLEPLSKNAPAGMDAEPQELPSTSADENSNVLTNTPDIDTSINTIQPVKMSSAELKNTAIKKSKPVSSESYLTVQRLVWEVPDNLSYSNGIKTYLRTAGKSIKLSLSSDLLLATEYAYTNQIKVDMKLLSNGTVQDARVVSGSGSDQIDKIVLQSVKDTLNVVKPPSGEIKQPNFNLSLIIYL